MSGLSGKGPSGMPEHHRWLSRKQGNEPFQIFSGRVLSAERAAVLGAWNGHALEKANCAAND